MENVLPLRARGRGRPREQRPIVQTLGDVAEIPGNSGSNTLVTPDTQLKPDSISEAQLESLASEREVIIVEIRVPIRRHGRGLSNPAAYRNILNNIQLPGLHIQPKADTGEVVGTDNTGQKLLDDSVNLVTLNQTSKLVNDATFTILRFPAAGRGRGRGSGRTYKDFGVDSVLGLQISAYPFTVENLKRQDLSFETIAGTETFEVTGVLTMNTFHIVRRSSRVLDMLILMDCITASLQGLGSLHRCPNVGHIILSRRPSARIARVEVIEIPPLEGLNSNLITVKDLDTGRCLVIDWEKDGLPVDGFIMATPVIGYDIKLHEIPDVYPKILKEDLDEIVAKLRHQRNPHELVKHQDGTFSLICCSSRKNLGTRILQLGRWYWKTIALTLSPADRTDNEIKKAGTWDRFPTQYSFLPVGIPWNTYFKANVIRSLLPTQDDTVGYYRNIYVRPLTPAWASLAATLDAQVESYMAIVKPSVFYPAAGEPTFVKLPEDHPQIKDGTWHRMMRIDSLTEAYYDMDSGKLARIPRGDDRVEYRLVMPEFYRIPTLSLELGIVGPPSDNPTVRDNLNNLFEVNAQLHFKIVQSDQGLIPEQMLVARCWEAEKMFDS